MPTLTWLGREKATRLTGSQPLPTALTRILVQIEDGWLLIVEDKGTHLLTDTNTTGTKTIGELWEAKSRGRGLFLMASGDRVREEIDRKVKGQ